MHLRLLRPRWIRYILVTGLGICNVLLWSDITSDPEMVLKVSVLDVGQGDAILIQSPTGIDMLIDGGPDRSVLRQLPKELGLLDRTIDVLVATHPDKDHVAGLPDVLERYTVHTILAPGIFHKTAFAAAFEAAVRAEGTAVALTARRGIRIHLGGGAYADVLYPDRDVTNAESNSGSIVMRVVYGATSFMLTGDAPSSVEDYLISIAPDAVQIRSTVLKAGHHGSKTSTSAAWLAAVQPKVVAISAGKENRYGHPNTHVTERIAASAADSVSTIDSGTLRFESNGVEVMFEGAQ